MHDVLTGTTWSRNTLMQLITGLASSTHSYKPCDVFIYLYACVCVFHCLIYWSVAFDTRIIMSPSFPITSEQDKCRYQFPITAVECFREWNQTALLKSPFAAPDLIMWGLWHSGVCVCVCVCVYIYIYIYTYIYMYIYIYFVHHLIYCISSTQCAFHTIVWMYSVYFPEQH